MASFMLGIRAGCFIFKERANASSAEQDCVGDTLRQLHPRVPLHAEYMYLAQVCVCTGQIKEEIKQKVFTVSLFSVTDIVTFIKHEI